MQQEASDSITVYKETHLMPFGSILSNIVLQDDATFLDAANKIIRCRKFTHPFKLNLIN